MAEFFSAEEVAGLKYDLVVMLDAARRIAAVPFRITSGLRTDMTNREAGGVHASAHLTGEAVDLAVPDATSRFRMLQALLKVGFNRIGVYDQHIHVDISTVLPQGVAWTGVSH